MVEDAYRYVIRYVTQEGKTLSVALEWAKGLYDLNIAEAAEVRERAITTLFRS
jgi:hypothetical protein